MAAKLIDIQVQLRSRQKLTIVKWIKPPSGCYKLNIEGSTKGSLRESAVGGMVRDSYGRPILSFSEFIGVGSNIMAEIIAIWRGLLLCSDHKFFPLWIETDSLVSLFILRSQKCSWELDHIVSRIHILTTDRSIHMSHILRERNSVADALATSAHEHKKIYCGDECAS